MLTGTALLAVSTLIGTVIGGSDWLTIVLMAVWGFGAGLMVCLGMAPAFLGVTAALGLLLSAYFPGGIDDALVRAGWSAVGALAQTGLALAIWPLRPFRPERRATANAYRALATFVDAMAAGASTDAEVPKLLARLDAAKALLDDAEGRSLSNLPAVEAFRTLVLEADRAYPEVIALVHAQPELPPQAGAALRDALAATAEALRAIAGELTGGPPCDEQVEANAPPAGRGHDDDRGDGRPGRAGGPAAGGAAGAAARGRRRRHGLDEGPRDRLAPAPRPSAPAGARARTTRWPSCTPTCRWGRRRSATACASGPRWRWPRRCTGSPTSRAGTGCR